MRITRNQPMARVKSTIGTQPINTHTMKTLYTQSELASLINEDWHLWQDCENLYTNEYPIARGYTIELTTDDDWETGDPILVVALVVHDGDPRFDGYAETSLELDGDSNEMEIDEWVADVFDILSRK